MAFDLYQTNLKPIQGDIIRLTPKEQVQKMTKPLLEWYQKYARILPWRDNPLPYYVWVSEIMLQQTRVEAVKPYFSRFIHTLPDIKALAEAKEEVLLKLWEGLGYYNRVRNLQKAAILIMEKYQGQLPASYEELQKLPGIGSYTAGAIASIAYHLPAPAVDGNVLRVMARITANREDILKQSVKKEAEKLLKENMPKKQPDDFNQALMELGAMICLPNGFPKCEECPAAFLCKAKIEDIIMELPVKASKKARKIEERTILLIHKEKQIAIHKREQKGLLAGLYEFPNLEGKLSKEEVCIFLEKQGFTLLKIKQIARAKHIFSHIEWHMTGYEIELKEKQAIEENKEFLFKDIQQVKEKYTIPNAFAVYKKYIEQEIETEKDCNSEQERVEYNYK